MGMYYIITCCTCILLHINLVSSRTGNTNCKVFNTNLLRCHGEYPSKAFYLNDITELYLEKLTWENLNLNYIIEKFPNLNKLSVNESEITSITISNKSNNIKVLLLRTNKIKSLPSNFITYLPELEMLFLENNKLVEMPVNFHLGNLQKMYIRNNPWKCAKDLTWALQLNKSVVKDIVNATCKDKYAGKNLLLIAKYKEEMNSNCIKTCECSLENVVQDAKTDKVHPIPIIMMNCSHQGFTEMPTQLPLHTRILHLEGNLISDIRVLKNNPVFKSLWDLYLDNNTITSISYLEGSYWLENFRVFSLRGNKLAKLPAFALDNALMKNPNMPGAVVLYLGGNPWRCDCIFVPVFQELVLQKYSTRIEDIKDVKCSYVEGDENSLLPIINLSRSSVCMVPSDFSLQEGLDLLNAILASLIVFVLGKLAYDYYHFKKSGRLPWIVTKMP